MTLSQTRTWLFLGSPPVLSIRLSTLTWIPESRCQPPGSRNFHDYLFHIMQLLLPTLWSSHQVPAEGNNVLHARNSKLDSSFDSTMCVLTVQRRFSSPVCCCSTSGWWGHIFTASPLNTTLLFPFTSHFVQRSWCPSQLSTPLSVAPTRTHSLCSHNNVHSGNVRSACLHALYYPWLCCFEHTHTRTHAVFE